MLRTLLDRTKSAGKQWLGPVAVRWTSKRGSLQPSLWDLAPGGDGALTLRGTSLLDLAEDWGTPLHVVDLQRLDAEAEGATAPSLAGCGAEIYYSYKTNPVPGFLRRLHDRGVGAEVISEYELWLALQMGVAPEQIVYNGPAKSRESLRLAVRHGVRLVNANSIGDLRQIAAVAAEEQSVVRVGLRVAIPGSWGGQFGIPSTSPALCEAVSIARSSPHLDLTGVHVHRGGTIRSIAQWESFVGSVLAACSHLTSSTDWSPSVIDLGGGLACPTVASIPEREFRLNRALGLDLRPPDPFDAVSIARASEVAATMVRRHYSGGVLPVPDVLMEPGRALSSSSQLMLTTVLDVKDDVEPVHAVLDAGSNLADPLPHEFHQVFSVSEPMSAPARRYRLVGPICTPADVLYLNQRLPELEMGQVLAVMDTGAYFVPFSTSFSFPQPAIVGLDDGQVSEMRRRETYEDLIRRDQSGPNLSEAAG